jgi:hypothetical protein
MAWKVVLRCDIIKGQWDERLEAFVYWEGFWVMGSGHDWSEAQ